MTFYCVDASVIVASLTPVEVAYPESRAFMDEWELQRDSLVCPELTKVEVAATIARNRQDEQFAFEAVAYLNRMPAFKFIPFGSRYMQRAIECAAHFRLRAADACYVTLAMRYRLRLVTLDREIIRVAEQTGEFRALTPRLALSL